MAQLPPNGEYLVQSEGNSVFVINRDTEEEFYTWPANNPHETTITLGRVFNEENPFTLEQKAMIAFWAGYFYAHKG